MLGQLSTKLAWQPMAEEDLQPRAYCSELGLSCSLGSSGFFCGEKSLVRFKWGKEIGLESEDWDNWRKKKTGMGVAKMDRDQRERNSSALITTHPFQKNAPSHSSPHSLPLPPPYSPLPHLLLFEIKHLVYPSQAELISPSTTPAAAGGTAGRWLWKPGISITSR